MAFIDTRERFPLSFIDLMKLKECPFCGGKARVEHYPYNLPDFVYAVRCTTCNGKSGGSGTALTAVKNWNRRVKK